MPATISRTPIADLPVRVLREALLFGTDATVAQRFGVRPGTIYRWRLRLLPHTRVGRGHRPAPRRQQILALLAQHPEGLRLCEIVRRLADHPGRQNMLQVLTGAKRWGLVTRQGARWVVVQQTLGLQEKEGRLCETHSV